MKKILLITTAIVSFASTSSQAGLFEFIMMDEIANANRRTAKAAEEMAKNQKAALEEERKMAQEILNRIKALEEANRALAKRVEILEQK